MLASSPTKAQRAEGQEDAMKVVVATKHGAAEEIAEAIAHTLRDQGLESIVLDPERVDAAAQSLTRPSPSRQPAHDARAG
jgi:hypothetical protein